MIERNEWSEDYLLKLISDKIPESINLDYKASGSLDNTDGKKKEIGKDVSAFANSAGGVIVYGIAEVGIYPDKLDGGVDPKETTKEWLENVIMSHIQRRVMGVRIFQVPLQTTAPGRVAYVVSIPASPYAPHMATGNRYYKRYNFSSVPMEEFEVRDVSRRLVSPDVSLLLDVANTSPLEPRSPSIRLIAYLENFSPAHANSALITFHVSNRNQVTLEGLPKASDTTVVMKGIGWMSSSYKLEWRGAMRLPLMQGAKFQIAELLVNEISEQNPLLVFWEVIATDAPPNRGTISVSLVDNGNGATVTNVEEDWFLPQSVHWKV